MEIRGRQVSVIGAGKSGLVASKVLAELGARVLLSDSAPRDRLETVLHQAALPESIEIESGGHTERVLSADFIVLSPGVPGTIPILQKAQQRGIPILSEIEIAYRLSRGRRLVITGSNGKTTTTTLLGKFCETGFPRVFVGGNIGTPMMEFALSTRENDIQVLEVSSFQLETISEFTPDIAMITNFYENHLDRYVSYEAYKAAKERIALNMRGDQWLILNADQRESREVASRAQCSIAWFGWQLEDRRPGMTFEGTTLIFVSADGKRTPLFDDRDIRLLGRHNRENVMAAATAAILAGVPPAGLKQVVQTFPGVEHRLEWVRERSGVAYVNDSKGTNCAASIIALQACTTPVILIAGGRDKGTDLRDWVEAVRLKARGVVLLGEAKERFRAALEGVVPLKMAGTFADAVRLASDWALSGETVLLSPACSSYDMFPNFEVRGACFKDLVMKL